MEPGVFDQKELWTRLMERERRYKKQQRPWMPLLKFKVSFLNKNMHWAKTLITLIFEADAVQWLLRGVAQQCDSTAKLELFKPSVMQVGINHYCCTCREVFIDWPVIHLQRSIPTIPGKTNHMILQIIHWGAAFLNSDILRPNVEGNANLPLFLK